MHTRSQELFKQAQELIPGGVNSPVRACKSVDCAPLFIASGQGSSITDADGATYIDYVQSWGPLLLGHAHPEVGKALHAAVDKGTSYGAPCEAEVLLARAVRKAMPHVEMLRMVNSGTEATMSALRLARGVTGRDKLIKFEGCYHGHGDAFLAAAGSGVATFSVPGTPGVPAPVVADTLIAPYNDLDAVKELFKAHPKGVAAVIVEPVAANMGLVLPVDGFLPGLRKLCDEYGAVLIFDEVITGFRVRYGGASAWCGVTPDLVTMGKIIGGGLPVGAYGGCRELMSNISPSGGIYQAGTLSGNPLAMAAGLATLQTLENCDYAALETRTAELARNIEKTLRGKGIPAHVTTLASMFTIFFQDGPVRNFNDVKKSDTTHYTKLYQQLRKAGVYIAPSAFETAMVSFAHSDADFAATLKAVEGVEF